MELGIHFIDFLPGGAAQLAPALLATATAAEDIGATMFTLADHFFQMENVGRAEDPFLEGYTRWVIWRAGRRDHAGVAGYRGHLSASGLLAKTVTTLDVLSQGRSMFGIGAAWYERDISPWESRIRRWAPDSRCSRRLCRSVSRCGATTTDPTRQALPVGRNYLPAPAGPAAARLDRWRR